MECYNFTCYSYAVLCLALSYLFIQFQLNSAAIYAAFRGYVYVCMREGVRCSIMLFTLKICSMHFAHRLALGGNRFGIHTTDFFYTAFTDTVKTLKF